jgi:hypothetical protein
MAANPSMANRPFQISAWGVNPQAQALRLSDVITFTELVITAIPNLVVIKIRLFVSTLAFYRKD